MNFYSRLFIALSAFSASATTVWAQSEGALSEGDVAPNWTVPDRLNNDNGVSMYDFDGKIIFIDFYAHY